MIKKNSVSRKHLHKNSNKHSRLTKTKLNINQPYIKLHNLSTITNKNILLNNNTNINNTNINNINNDDDNENYIVSEVIDDTTYNHFKLLIKQSPNLCKGQTQTGEKYKIRKSILKDMKTLKKDNHYRIIYIHNNKEVIAYISTKLYSKDGGFMFIHKLCSKSGSGQGSILMNMILDDARMNYKKLGITYLSLTTQNLDIVGYYNKFNPTRVIEVDTPESKAKIPKKCAYMIWQVSPNMPYLNYV